MDNLQKKVGQNIAKRGFAQAMREKWIILRGGLIVKTKYKMTDNTFIMLMDLNKLSIKQLMGLEARGFLTYNTYLTRLEELSNETLENLVELGYIH